jgi:hypothetical protein
MDTSWLNNVVVAVSGRKKTITIFVLDLSFLDVINAVKSGDPVPDMYHHLVNGYKSKTLPVVEVKPKVCLKQTLIRLIKRSFTKCECCCTECLYDNIHDLLKYVIAKYMEEIIIYELDQNEYQHHRRQVFTGSQIRLKRLDDDTFDVHLMVDNQLHSYRNYNLVAQLT